MRRAILIFLLLATMSSAHACESGAKGNEISRPAFVDVDLSRLSDKDRSTVAEAMDDFEAVLAGKKPVHAVLDTQAPVPSDGGTTFYSGRGYRLTIEHAFSEIGSTTVVAYGPILVFNDKLGPGNENRISDVRFYSHERLDELLSCGQSGHSRSSAQPVARMKPQA